jgi:hypothetical protein
MTLQFEDVVDSLQVKYPCFDFVSQQGHLCKQNSALSWLQMTKVMKGDNQSWETRRMEEMVIVANINQNWKSKELNQWCSDPTTPVQGISDEQQREAQWHYQTTGQSRRKERAKKLLTKAASKAGIELQEKQGYTREELQFLRSDMGLPSSKTRNKSSTVGNGSLKALC